MLIFTDNIRWLVVWSITVGGALCLLYDVLRVIRSLLSIETDVSGMRGRRLFVPKFVFLVLTDFLFCIAVAICFLSLAHYTNGGVFRGLLVVCAALGFIVIRLTVSRLFVFLLNKLTLVLKKILTFLVLVLSKIVKPVFWLYHLTLGRIICIIKDRVKKKRERREEERRNTGKEENVTLIKACTETGRKERIVIGRRAEKS